MPVAYELSRVDRPEIENFTSSTDHRSVSTEYYDSQANFKSRHLFLIYEAVSKEKIVAGRTDRLNYIQKKLSDLMDILDPEQKKIDIDRDG